MLIIDFFNKVANLTDEYTLKFVNLDESTDNVNYVMNTSKGYGLLRNELGRKLLTLGELRSKYKIDIEEKVLKPNSEISMYDEEFHEIYELYDIEIDLENKQVNILI